MCAIGYYTYKGDDQADYTTYYIADEYGYRPVGDHLHPSIKKLLLEVEDRAERYEKEQGFAK